MRSTVIGLAAAVITAGSLSAFACPYHQGYGGARGEYGRGEYRPALSRDDGRQYGRREYPGGKVSHREYRGGYGGYRD